MTVSCAVVLGVRSHRGRRGSQHPAPDPLGPLETYTFVVNRVFSTSPSWFSDNGVKFASMGLNMIIRIFEEWFQDISCFIYYISPQKGNCIAPPHSAPPKITVSQLFCVINIFIS